MEYFKDITNLSELSKQYKELLKVHHSDNGGNVAEMQEIINNQNTIIESLQNSIPSN